MKQMAGHLQLAMAPLVFVQKSLLLEGPEPAWLSLSAGETACISDKSAARAVDRQGIGILDPGTFKA